MSRSTLKAPPIQETLGFTLARACRAHRGAVSAALAPTGLHAGQEMVLLRLWEEDGIPQSVLAERVGIEASTVSNMLTRLERAGFVRRMRDAEDARTSRAYLTQKGRETRGPVERGWAEAEQRAFRGLSFEERRVLLRALGKVRANLGEGPKPGVSEARCG